MAKNKQQIKFEADISGFKTNIKEAQSTIKTLNNELKLNQEQLKGNKENTYILSQRIETLKQKYEEQTKVVDNTRASYEKAVEVFGENSKEAENLKNKLLQAETAQQNIKNEIDKTNQQLTNQTDKLLKTSKAWQESGETLKDYGSKIEKVGNKLSIVSGIVAGAGIVSVKSAIDVETSIQQIENIYGNASNTIKDFAENTAISFNMSKSEAYKYSQVFGNLIQSMTDDQTENAQYTQDLLKASAVIASSTGRTIEDVMDRIRSGLLGNTEAIEDLGVNVNVSLLESTDAFKRFAGDKSWQQLDFQTQQQIRLFAILEQTTKKYGDEVQDNTSSSIQQLSAKTKNLTTDLGKKLLPIANDLLEKANDLVDGFSDLSDEEQENILKIGGLVAVAGPAIKLAGTGIKTIGSVKTALGTLKGAISVLNNGTEGASKSSINLAKSLQTLVSPTGVVIATIGALAGAYTWLKNESEKIPEELQKNIDKMQETKNAHEEYRAELDKTASTSLAEIENTENLRNELTKLVDENGKVKEGYKDRVSVILNELNKALGTEYSLTGNIISQYQTLQEEIDLLILKKKAQIVLENEESKYETAIQNKTSAYQTMIDAQNEYNNALQEQYELNKNLQGMTYDEIYNYKIQDSIKAGYTEEKSIEHAKSYMAKWLDGYKQNYETAEQIYGDYLTDIAKYENDYAIMQSNNTEKIKQMTDERINNYGRENLSRQEQIKEGIQQEIYNVNEFKRLYEEDLKNQNEISAQANASALESSRQRLQILLNDLSMQTSTVNENSPEVIEAWKQLATNSYSVYYDQVSQLPEELSKKIQEMTGVTIERTPELVNETKNMADQVLAEFENNEEFRKTAITNLQSYLNGLEDEKLRELLKEAGTDNVDEVIKGIRVGNLSEDEGKKILSGLQTGLENTTWRDKLWSTARGIASTLSGLLTVKANVNGSTSDISKIKGYKTGLDYVPYDNYIARLHKGERVLTAQENKEYMAGNIENKVSSRNIVVQFFPQSMTETELQRAETYIAKKWGMAL